MSEIDIAELRKKLNISQGRLAELVGVSLRTIQNYESGGVIPKSKHAIFHNLTNVNIGDVDKSKEGESLSNSENGVPYWNLPVSAGRKIKDVIGAKKPDGYISGLPGADMAENILPITGTSMEPEVVNGAIIGVKRMNNWETLNTERIYLIITHDDRMIKRIKHDKEDTTILWCVSPNYPEFKIYKEDIIEIQRVCFVYNPK